MSKIKIIQYEHKYARSLSEMWRLSQDSWGGGSSAISEQDIKNDQDNSSFINTYLALDGDIVVGLCTFSELQDDSGALYIPTLNVIPDYQGKGIGKALVLKVLERTVELGWPRLDLNTWPGNTKAVPLYKKCGFFWEKRDYQTHLMNFIPTVLHTDAVKDYFKTLNYYEDLIRKLDVVPDGIKVGDFEYYEYLWENEDTSLRMQFEKTGRGLRLIETNDYLIEVSLKKHTLVFGENYQVQYRIINKTETPLDIKIEGLSNKVIDYDFNKRRLVKEEEILENSFYVNETLDNQDPNKNHPTLDSYIYIEGKKALFKLGVFPLSPCNITLKTLYDTCLLNQKQEMVLDIENNLDHKVTFSFNLNNTDKISFSNNHYDIELNKKEKRSIPIDFILLEHHIYNAQLDVRIIVDNQTLNFTRTVDVLFLGADSMYGGKSEKYYYIVNGTYYVKINQENMTCIPYSIKESQFETTLIYPQIGKPFSEEFARTKPLHVAYQKDYNYIGIRLFYKSSQFSAIEFVTDIKLYGNGLISYQNEITNTSDSDIYQDLWIKQRIVHDLFDTIIPYENQYVNTNSTTGVSYESLEGSKLTENWLFSEGNDTSRGVCWHEDYRMNFLFSIGYLSINLGKIRKNETKKTEALYLTLDTFKDVNKFRLFALKEKKEEIILSDEFNLTVNQYNPFVYKECPVELKEYKNIQLKGRVIFDRNKETVISFNGKEKEKKLFLPITDDIENLLIKFDFDTQYYEKSKVLFKVQDCKIKQVISKEEGLDVHTVSNGVIKIKAANGYSQSLYSLTYQNNEWLDSSFPNPTPLSWFNPWTGGISLGPEKINDQSIYEAKRTASFIELKDNFSNNWQGIKITLDFTNQKNYKGLKIDQYFLMLPGVSILAFTSKIIQNTNKLLKNESFVNYSFLKLDDHLLNGNVLTEDKHGEKRIFKCGRDQAFIHSKSHPIYYSNNRKEKLTVFSKENDQMSFINNKVTAFINELRLTIKDKDAKFTKPVFYILSEKDLPQKGLEDLKLVYFK